MPDDPPTQRATRPATRRPGGKATRADADAPERLRRTVVAGHRGDAASARRGLRDPDAAVRAAALGALSRAGALRVDDVVAALGDLSPAVRRRACQEAAALGGRGSRTTLPASLRQALDDRDPLVVEAACWALGERRVTGAVDDLLSVAGSHPDARGREAAVAALGALGDPSGLPGVLGALGDKVTVRRRAVVALAAFGGPEVEAALRRCLDDHDWQVRQAAQVLLEG